MRRGEHVLAAGGAGGIDSSPVEELLCLDVLRCSDNRRCHNAGNLAYRERGLQAS